MTKFTPFSRCPGVAGVECQALIDASSTKTCGSCRGLARMAAPTPSSKMPRGARARRRDANAAPPAEGVRPPSSPPPGSHLPNTTTNKTGKNHAHS